MDLCDAFCFVLAESQMLAFFYWNLYRFFNVGFSFLMI